MEADEYLKTVGLSESSHTLIRISAWENNAGGDCQGLAKRRLLILDEPTASLIEDDC